MSACYPSLSCLRLYTVPRHTLSYSLSSKPTEPHHRHPHQHEHNYHYASRPHHRFFHTTRSHHATHASPYDVLGLAPTCTQAEIKKQFYALSKAHHPDHNPNDQDAAAQKFVAISDAYHQIGNPAARAKFDQENGPRPSWGGMGPGEDGMGAPSGSGFGARRASGLSRRRTQFKGPPPSFYKNGGYGSAQTAQERAAATEAFRAREEEATRNQSAWGGSSASGDGNPFGGGGGGSTGGYAGQTGSWPFQTDMNDVPHFDREGHFRTTSSLEDQLRQGRSKRRQAVQEARREEEFHEGGESAADVLGKFVLYGGTLVIGIAGSSWLMKATQ